MTDDPFSDLDPTLPGDGDDGADADATRRPCVGDEPPSEAVVRAVADALDRDPVDLPPLHDALDPDALDDLYADTVRGGRREGRFVFEFCGCTVALLSSEEVAVAVND